MPTTARLLGVSLVLGASVAHASMGDLPPDLSPPATVNPPPSAQTAAPAAPETARNRFDVEMTAPDSMQAFLLRHLDLQRYRQLDDLDANELERLLARTPDNLKNLLGTLGHFSPRVAVRLDRASTSSTDGSAAPLGTVHIDVAPGPVTKITSQRIFFHGDIATNASAAAQRSAIEQAGTVPDGEAFTQAQWEQAKTRALRRLTSERYPNGRLLNSLADIDAKTQQAHLYMELDSGPARQLGDMRVTGAERYDPEQPQLLARLAGVEPGVDYSLERLQAAQTKIAASGRYESVLVTVEPAGDEVQMPVLVQLRERERQRLQVGLGGSTDNGPRVSLEYSHLKVPGTRWRSDNRIQLERQDKLAQTVWTAPLGSTGWHWGATARWAQQIDDYTTTTSQRLRWGRSQESDAQDQGQYVQFDRARTINTVEGEEVRERSRSALSINQAWTWRRFNDLVFPQRGQGLSLELGLGATLEGVPQPFFRTHARWLTFWPLGRSPSPTPPSTQVTSAASPALASADEAQDSLGRLSLRLEGGAVAIRQSDALPDTQLFLAGGDASVRGYGLREIGIAQATGGVVPGRYMAVASLEWQRPIWRDGQRTAWEHVVFIDGGAVANRSQDLRAQWGIGSGVRYNSPVGPLQLDLAYGLEPRAWRLHMSVGFAF